eukprot:Em0007g536a
MMLSTVTAAICVLHLAAANVVYQPPPPPYPTTTYPTATVSPCKGCCPPGPPGHPGDKGDTGAPGSPGADGKIGLQGTSRTPGVQGRQRRYRTPGSPRRQRCPWRNQASLENVAIPVNQGRKEIREHLAILGYLEPQVNLDKTDMMAKMVRKENLEHQVLLATLVPMVLMESLARRERRVHLAPREPLDHKALSYFLYDRACTGSELYIKWGSKDCLNGEVNLFSGHIVTSNNLKDVDGDFICLPTDHNAYPTRIQNAKLRLEDVNDAKGKSIPCAACVVRNRSIIFTFTDTTTCPQKWSCGSTWDSWRQTQRIQEMNICVDTATSNGLLNYPSKDLAVIATGSYNALRRVQAAGCSVLRRVLNLNETACMNVHISHMLYCICALYKHKL